jgi:hypothetical protein
LDVDEARGLEEMLIAMHVADSLHGGVQLGTGRAYLCREINP